MLINGHPIAASSETYFFVKSFATTLATLRLLVRGVSVPLGTAGNARRVAHYLSMLLYPQRFKLSCSRHLLSYLVPAIDPGATQLAPVPVEEQLPEAPTPTVQPVPEGLVPGAQSSAPKTEAAGPRSRTFGFTY